MHPKDISISDYTYDLPDQRIARYPLEERDASKLLLCKKGHISETRFRQLADFVPAQSLLVFNNSKVVEARLLFEKATGGIIEIFALEPHEQYADITTAMNVTGSIQYKCMVGGASKWKHGMVLQKQSHISDGRVITVSASIAEKRSDCFVIRFEWQPASLAFAQILHVLGEIPIPPYLQRQAEASDQTRYQTIYAKNDGSVAAPTAGLHFTQPVFEALQQKQIDRAFTTLHVGAGTFKPVKASTMAGHEMHAEFMEIDTALLRQLLQYSSVIPVGTTSMRTLESIYWMGVKAWHNQAIALTDLEIKQWEVYDELADKTVERNEALQALLHWMEHRNMGQLIVKTSIIIAPGYTFRICDGLITNFHQPNSTLLLLVAALIGPDWKAVYAYALENDFRFLSYGDSSLLLP
jgi:S-adenosylmethionine:tRNA ribosyltransferase-isomerase